MDFTQKITMVFATPDSENVWAYIDAIGWRKVQSLSTDGCTNMFLLLTAAKTSGLDISGTLTDTTASGEITEIYL